MGRGVATMGDSATAFGVRELGGDVVAIDLQGDITGASEDLLMDAYARANESAPTTIVLNFDGLDYMNSGGIGLLVTLLVRAQRQKQSVLAHGLSEHYRQIFELTRLDEAMAIHESEADALAAAGAV
jgi:anti-sigma B factor antagonist